MNSKVTVEEINVKESIEEISRKEQRNRQRDYNIVAPTTRYKIIKRYWGGLCIRCGALPSKKVSYDVGDNEQHATRIERYCQACWEKNKVQLLDTGQRNQTIAVRDVKNLSRVVHK